MTEWWKYGNIVEQQNTTTRNKSVNMIDRMAAANLQWKQQRKQLGQDISQDRQERLACYLKTQQDERIRQKQFQLQNTQNRLEKAEEWAKWAAKQEGTSWADLNPDEQSDRIGQAANWIMQSSVDTREPTQSTPFAPQTRAWLAGTAAGVAEKFGWEGSAERLREEQQYFAEAQIPKEYQLPEGGIDLGEGFTVLPDYSVVSGNTTVGSIDPETGEFQEKQPGA